MLDATVIVASNSLIKVVPGLMIWTLVAFGLTFIVLKKYAFGPIQKAIDDRRGRISNALDEADRAREESQKLLDEHRALVAGARTDASKILAEAREEANVQRDQLRQELDAERTRRIDEARKEIEGETRRALEQIRSEVADLTLEATQKVTGKVLDTADHRRLIEEAIGDLDFSVLEREHA